MAPIDYKPSDAHGEGGHLRISFSGVLAEPPRQLSLLVFVLFMLSSTAFDGLHETVVWENYYGWIFTVAFTILDWHEFIYRVCGNVALVQLLARFVFTVVTIFVFIGVCCLLRWFIMLPITTP